MSRAGHLSFFQPLLTPESCCTCLLLDYCLKTAFSAVNGGIVFSLDVDECLCVLSSEVPRRKGSCENAFNRPSLTSKESKPVPWQLTGPLGKLAGGNTVT